MNSNWLSRCAALGCDPDPARTILISKRLFGIVTALLAMLAFADTTFGAQPTLGIVALDLQNSFFVRMKKAADIAAKDYGVNTSWQSADGSLEKEVALVENFTNQKVSAILIDPVDKNALVNVIKKAEAAGVTVITMGNKVEAGSSYATLYPDYENMSVVASALGTRLGGKGKIALLVGARGNFVSDTREKSFLQTMKRDFPGIKIVGTEPTNWDPLRAANGVQTWLITNPDLKAIACISDSLCLSAEAVAAYMGSELLYGGYDGDSEMYPMLESGKMVLDVLAGAYRVGYWNIAVAARIVAGHKLPHDLYMPTYFVSSEATSKALDKAGLKINSITPEKAMVESETYAKQFGPSQPDDAMTIVGPGELRATPAGDHP
ncbi:MAG: sugar ABC transporter substrate-binding protein [Steroidobacteraceae bacterium]